MQTAVKVIRGAGAGKAGAAMARGFARGGPTERSSGVQAGLAGLLPARGAGCAGVSR
jgi:hypothetical protein